ncbi:MAG: efflux RND transporter periplasmic adaptor subunit [Gammaproteobacteria bacterium]|nr:efflux RND transporter periplasmic adaptor subunit [Gammaproteobacteria bacterium]
MKILRVLLPIAVLAVSGAIAYVTVVTAPQAERRTPPPTLPSVDVLPTVRSDYAVVLQTQGTVQPRTESNLIAEVAGRVVAVSPSFREGGFFEAGDVLLSIDPRDYRTAITIAESNLAQARLALEEERARAAQAEIDWKRLGGGEKPSALVLRKPQLASARAAVAAAVAELERARLNLERTAVAAPYAGRVLENNVDIGQYVSPGTVLARVYAVDYAEIRLPLTPAQLEHIDVPEQYRGDSETADTGPRVTLTASIGRRSYRWQGRIVRAEGAIDTLSRQTFVVAQVDDPYGKRPSGAPPLKVGQFVEAAIEGRLLRDVIVLPRAAIRLGGAVDVVDVDKRISRRKVEVVWRDPTHVVVGEGLGEGELVSLTPITFSGSTTVRTTLVDEQGRVVNAAEQGGGEQGGERAESSFRAENDSS